MTNSQNPSVNLPLQQIEIDAVVMDIQYKLDTNLLWLSHDYARSYRHVKQKGNNLLYFPEVYIGKKEGIPSYYRPTPDNDKKGLCFFVVGKEEQYDFNSNEKNYLKHDLGIVFWVNLELINSALLETELFTQHLIRDVRNVLTSGLLGTNYRVEIINVCREFNEIYKEFSLDEAENYLMAPYQAFRFNCSVIYQEDCINLPISKCNILNQNISDQEILDCLLPRIDFSIQENFDALSVQQKSDLLVKLTP